ncbi:DNA polymerase III subunit delta [Candidatus Peregrinibacteria bacterium]|nr:DNA polymerase III subunit delta [Candidatus Peregrinibacteria bacterium]
MANKNIYLFHGEDTYTSLQKVKFWKTQFKKKFGENSNIEIFDGEKIDINNFETDLTSLPFLCDKRLIIIKNIFQAKEDIKKRMAESILKTPDFCILVFHENKPADKRLSLYKKITKIGKTEEFKPFPPIELNKWIMAEAQKQKMKITINNANLLAQQIGADLWRLSSELNKLKSFSQNREITEQTIARLIKPSLSSSIFQLTDYLSQKRIKESIKTFENLIESGEELTKIFYMIIRHFRVLIQVHYLVSKGESKPIITKTLKEHPFVIQKSMQQSKNFSAKKLKSIYAHLLDIEISLKTGKIRIRKTDISEAALAIEKFIWDCCN